MTSRIGGSSWTVTLAWQRVPPRTGSGGPAAVDHCSRWRWSGRAGGRSRSSPAGRRRGANRQARRCSGRTSSRHEWQRIADRPHRTVEVSILFRPARAGRQADRHPAESAWPALSGQRPPPPAAHSAARRSAAAPRPDDIALVCHHLHNSPAAGGENPLLRQLARLVLTNASHNLVLRDDIADGGTKSDKLASVPVATTW